MLLELWLIKKLNIEINKIFSMKKTYINPTLTVVEIKPTNLLQVMSLQGRNAEAPGMTRRTRFSDFDEWDEE